MEKEMPREYYVVEFLDPPYKGFDQFVCIPRSWVLMEDENYKLVVKYPVEKSSTIKQRVKDDDSSSIDWSIYVANFRMKTESYQNAENYIMELNKSPQEDPTKKTKAVKFMLARNHADGQLNSVASTSKGTVAQEAGGREREIENQEEVAKQEQIKTGVSKGRESINDRNDEENVTPKRKRIDNRRRSLLPDPNKDTTWTLRYPERSAELVELVEDSKVFVNAAYLHRCERLASQTKDAKALARMIVLDVFSDSALNKCYFPAGKANDTSKLTFDRLAQKVLLRYVKDYASDHNWPQIDESEILNSLRKKIYNMKR